MTAKGQNLKVTIKHEIRKTVVSDDADRMNAQYFKCKVTQACGLRKYNINGTH